MESERLEKEAEEQRQREIDELDKALNQASGSAVAMGRRLNASKQKWKEEASDEEEITQEDLEKWKDSDGGTWREDCLLLGTVLVPHPLKPTATRPGR